MMMLCVSESCTVDCVILCDFLASCHKVQLRLLIVLPWHCHGIFCINSHFSYFILKEHSHCTELNGMGS